MAVPNLFRLRYTEQLRDSSAFLRTFGVEMLDVLPGREVAWNRLVVLRSASGAGKTSILRLLTPESLTAILNNDGHEEIISSLRQSLEGLGVVDEDRIAIMGIMVGVGKDYRSLLDLGPAGAGNQKIFFRLLDARILVRTIEAFLAAYGLSYPADASRLSIVPRDGATGEVALDALRQILPMLDEETTPSAILGGVLLKAIREDERAVVARLDSLLEVDWGTEHGHSRLWSLQLLGSVDFAIDGERCPVEPVVLFDDVHDLADDQRRALYEQLLDRSVAVGRWIAERKTAVPHDELLMGTTRGREFELVSLEEELMSGAKGGHSSPRLERILGSIANSRAAMPLSAAGVSDPFTTLISVNDAQASARDREVRDDLLHKMTDFVAEHNRYRSWLDAAETEMKSRHPLEAAIDIQERLILMQRDIARSQPTLFDLDVSAERADELASPSTRAAARLFIARDYRLPYYYGPNVLADLASRNVEQYLGVAGDLFDMMTSAVTLRRGAHLTSAEQDQRVRRTSRRLWESVSKRVENGPDVLALLHLIADRARAETYRPTAPYAPGVTGAGIGFHDRTELLGSQSALKGGRYKRLADAIATAVATNLLEMSSDPTRTKGREWSVLYLNRLLCPYFDLPLQRGGWREQSISKMSARLDLALTATADSRLPDPELPLSQLDGWPK